jgi:hypothetical protein
MQNVCCCGTAAYQSSGRTMAYGHENVPQNEKLTLFLDYYIQQ